MSRPYPWDLEQAGATDRQSLGWDEALGLYLPQTYISEIQEEGVALTRRAKLNFTGAGVTVTDDAVNDVTEVDIPGGGSGGSAHVIEDESIPLTARANLNFTGAGVTVTDDGVDTTVVTIPGASGSSDTTPDTPPPSADAFDYEFTADNVTTAPTGWTLGNSASYLERYGVGVISAPASAGVNLRYMDRAVPAGATWALVAKFALVGLASNFMGGGFCFRDSATGELISFQLSQNSVFELAQWSSATAYASDLGGGSPGVAFPLAAVFYQRVTKNSATSYDFAVSPDGATWRTQYTAKNMSAHLSGLDRVGFMANSQNSSPVAVGCHWMRKVA